MAFKDKSLKAYTGDQPYIFLSYSHDDSDKAEEIVRILTRSGYRVWYDEGIPSATRFAEVIAKQIQSCRLFFALFSDNFLHSEYCKKESYYAKRLKHTILPIYLENVNLREHPVMDMEFGDLQSVFFWKLDVKEELLKKILTVPGIESCREPVQDKKPEPSVSPVEDEASTDAPSVSPVEDFDFEASDDGVTITRYKGTGGAVVISSEIGGKPVTSIGNRAFAGCTGLTSVTIPNSVTSIGNSAFNGCTGLTSVTIPNSVTSIGYEAFDGCTGLTSVTIPDSVTSIGVWAFNGCTRLTSVTIPDSVTSIGKWAFNGCTRLTSVTIPNSVTSIGKWAFGGCTGLTSVTIPDSVTSIGGGAFAKCASLHSIVVSKKNPAFMNIDGVLYNRERTALLAFPKGKEAAAFIIPDSVTSIGYEAFNHCTGLTSVTIPNSVTSIGSEAFIDCTGLTSVTIPNSVTRIGDGAFYGCTGLTSVTIPNSVTSIRDRAFCGCANLTSVMIPDSVTSIGDVAFGGCERLRDVYFTGSKSQWEGIKIGRYNDPLKTATIHYNTQKPTASP